MALPTLPKNPVPGDRGGGIIRFVAGLVVGGLVVGVAIHSPRRPAVTVADSKLDPLRTLPKEYVWTEQPAPAFPLPPYAQYLKGMTIALDPGHVGQEDRGGTWKRGPTGLREAEVNLRVAQFLREFLNAAGASVIMTREVDKPLGLSDGDDLKDRAAIANRAGADLLLSIHHNGNHDPKPNYSSLFYHLTGDYSRASVCAARHLAAGLDEALRLPSHLACPVLNDRLLFKNGLAVLRETWIPAVLSEASFHSNPEEEERLRDPVYNRREAYGLFLGLARWAQAGRPEVWLARPSDGRVRAGQSVLVAIGDGLSARGGWGAERLRVVPDSIVVRVDGEEVTHVLDEEARQLRVTVPAGVSGRVTVFVDFENVLGQHVLHPRLDLDVSRR